MFVVNGVERIAKHGRRRRTHILKGGDIMSQTRIMENGTQFDEYFKLKKGETDAQMTERMLQKAQEKLRNPEVNKFFQVKVGRNEPCPCGSGVKFKKCCFNKCNEGEFEVKGNK